MCGATLNGVDLRTAALEGADFSEASGISTQLLAQRAGMRFGSGSFTPGTDPTLEQNR